MFKKRHERMVFILSLGREVKYIVEAKAPGDYTVEVPEFGESGKINQNDKTESLAERLIKRHLSACCGKTVSADDKGKETCSRCLKDVVRDSKGCIFQD